MAELSTVQGDQALREVLTSKNGIHIALLNLLLAAGANPNLSVLRGQAVLLDAISTKDAGSVETLLKADATTNLPFNSGVYYSPVQLTAKESSLEVLQMLLAHGCNPNFVAPCLQILPDNLPPGAEILYDEPIGSVIQCATERCDFEKVTLLLAHNADPNAVTKICPHTALQIASRDGSKSIAELLLMVQT